MTKSTPKTDDDMGFHPGFPPGFDPKRAEKGLAQESSGFLPLELVAEGRSGEGGEDAGEYRHQQWLEGLSSGEWKIYHGAPCSCGHSRERHRGVEYDGACGAVMCEKCERYHCPACDTNGGHQATCEHYVLGEGTPAHQG